MICIASRPATKRLVHNSVTKMTFGELNFKNKLKFKKKKL